MRGPDRRRAQRARTARKSVRSKRFAAPIFALVTLATPLAAAAEDQRPIATAGPEAQEVTVWGRRRFAGDAVAASEGEVAYGAYAERPLLRPGELVEVIPGMAATQHSGSGKANQYFLRGFNLDHGTDFSVSLDGVPLNLRTNAHGQGYLDLNAVTPELVETISYRKGPYYADVGDFSAAGSAAFQTFRSLPQSFVLAQAGQHDFGRLAAGVGADSGLIGVDLTTSAGPWVRSEGLRKASLLGRTELGRWSFTALAYGARWNSTDQIPQRAVDAGLISRLGTVDPTDGGRTSRFILSARRNPDADSDLVLYLQRYRLNLWSDFTYFLDDPVNGDQFEQAERRWVAGASGLRTWQAAGSPWRFRLGGETRLDDIGGIGLYRTRARQRLSTERQDRVKELSGAVWSEADWSEGPFRANLGLRTDTIYVDVRSDDPLNSGHAADALVSPKLALAWRLSPAVELYADAGRAYHSNDARGAVQRVSPTSLQPVEKVPLIVPADGAELGARYQGSGFAATASLWAMRLKSELVYAGDAGDTESTGATDRLGLEVLLNWTARPGLNLDLAAAATHARYRGDPPGGDRIPNALEYVVTGGVSARISARSRLQATVRRLGPAPLVEDDSVRSKPATVVNVGWAYDLGRASLALDLLNLFDSQAHDITYFYASRLPGEPAAGVDDVHFHPMEPRQVRVSLRYAL